MQAVPLPYPYKQQDDGFSPSHKGLKLSLDMCSLEE